MNYIITIYIWSLVLITFILFIPVITVLWLITVLFDKKLLVIHFFSSFWAVLYIWLNPYWKLKIEGKQKLHKKQTCVILSNHQSLLDIAILYGLFIPYKWVTKVENYKIPGIGWIMRLNRYINVDRKRKNTYLQMIEDCEKAIHQGSSVLLFPEGTRSKDGVIKEFKTGPFRVALNAKAPILPVVINGSGKTLRDNSYIFSGKQVLQVHILDPIPYEKIKDMDPKDIARYVNTMMVEEYKHITG